MSGYAYARRGARVVACILALGVAEAAAQEAPTAESSEKSSQSQPTPAAGTEAVTPSTAPQGETTPPQDTSTAPAGTADLPELVVDGEKTKQKKAATAKQNAQTTSASGDAPAESTPPPGVVLGSTAKADTGTTTFDAKNVEMRTDGGNDANTFMRNLPNVQYQNSNSSQPGATSQKTIDTKPALVSISGGRTYENNFIVNGVSVSNITGPPAKGTLDDYGPTMGGTEVYGMSPQNIYVPAEFVGQATVIDSNASAEYGQFQGGVVVYDLVAPPTDRYHASVSYSKDMSGWSNYILATPNGTNPFNYVPPSYEKTTMAVSIGAPITSDFAFIAQASRKMAESGKPRRAWITGYADEDSDNIFLRFAATARTDVGKFTFDTSHTDYYQHYEYPYSRDVTLDINTDSYSTKLEHEANLPGLRVDEIGLGRAKLQSRAFYNTTETQNNSAAGPLYAPLSQVLTYDDVTGTWREDFSSQDLDWCHSLDPATFNGDPLDYQYNLECAQGGFGNWLQSQVDYGVQTTLSADLLSGFFRVGAELKRYDGRSARMEDTIVTGFPEYWAGPYSCDPDYTIGGLALCSEHQFISNYYLYGKRDVRATVNALHTFAEIDQTLGWFNLRAGVRYDYDDYLKNNNFAPRLVGTVTPLEGVSFTGGYNRYYLGETLYYALRDKNPEALYFGRANSLDPFEPDPVGNLWGNAANYTVSGLSTPFSDEYSGAVSVVDPLLKGQWRLRYLERYGRDQFGTGSCGDGCFTTNNDGENFYRSASAEYFKGWSGLRNPVGLEAAAISGNVTWSEQKTSNGTFLLRADRDGDGRPDPMIIYKGKAYRPEEFVAVTGNLDIPVRFGGTLSTVWFNNLLELNLNAGVNLGFTGVYDTKIISGFFTNPICPRGVLCNEYRDRQFKASLKLDVNGQINVTEEAAIQFSINNITNSTQQTFTLAEDPWVLGRSYWIGSALRF